MKSSLQKSSTNRTRSSSRGGRTSKRGVTSVFSKLKTSISSAPTVLPIGASLAPRACPIVPNCLTISERGHSPAVGTVSERLAGLHRQLMFHHEPVFIADENVTTWPCHVVALVLCPAG